MTLEDEEKSILLEGDEIQPASIDEFVEAIDKNNRFHAMKLKWGMALKERFMEYMYDPTVEVECYYDRDLATYFYSVSPRKNSELKDMINEKLGIKEND